MSDSLPLPLDLNDPVVENEVADAIRRLAPTGEYVSFERRYPWRLHEDRGQPTPTAVADAVVDMLQTAGLVFTVPPGRCGAPPPKQSGEDITLTVRCENRAGHTGQHEATYWPPVAGLQGGMPISWDPIVDSEAVEEVEVRGMRYAPGELPDALALALSVQEAQTAEVRRLTLRLERVSALVAEGEALSGPAGQFADRLRAAFIEADPEPVP